MPVLLILQHVSDYVQWKRAFAKQAHARTANGCQNARIFRNSDDPEEIFVFLEWDSLVRARLFAQSDEFLETLDGDNPPSIWILEDVPEDGTPE